MTRKNILLYSPTLGGHPQVYCRVIGDIVLEHDASLIVLTRDIEGLANNWPDLSPLTINKNVQFISTLEYFNCQDGNLTAEQLRQLQVNYTIDVTLFIWPEFFRDEFIRIARGQAKMLCGHNVAIYGGTTKWYPGEEHYSGKKIRMTDSSVRQILGATYRRFTRPWTIDKYFFEKILIKNRILDTVLVKDERVEKKYPDLVRWMPEIYKTFTSPNKSLPNRTYELEYTLHKPMLKKYLSDVDPDDVVLFFGAGAWYKGYDFFLEFLALANSAVGIHAGSGIRHDEGKVFLGDPERLRIDLVSGKRLYETGKYVESQDLIDLVFRSTRRFVSTHRLTLSSGTMLQALDYGLPVLVPNSGLVGYRARANNLGETYQYGDYEDMARQWDKFRKIPIERYASSISTYMEQFSRENLSKLFVDVLVNEN